MRFLAAALILLLAAAPTRAFVLPSLPARVQFDADPDSDFCRSSALLDEMKSQFGTAGGPREVPAFDVRVVCEVHDANRVRFTVMDPHGKTIDGFKAKVTSDRDSYPAVAYLVGHRLGRSRKVIRAALDAYLRNSRKAFAAGGVRSFDAGNWEEAADQLYRGLESDSPTTALYFGLYAAHAKLGHAAQARWYLLEYCESEGKKPTQLKDSQLSYLRGIPPPPAGSLLPEPADLSEFRRLRAAHDWYGTLRTLKDLLEKAPWTVGAYEALADTYEALGWKPFEKSWRRRAKLAREVARDKKLQENLLDALQAP